MRRLVLVIMILLTSCKSLDKAKETKVTHIVEVADTTAVHIDRTLVKSEDQSEEFEWEWCPADSTSGDVEVQTPSGTKFKIPGKGTFKQRKKANHKIILHDKLDSSSVRKSTTSDVKVKSMTKEVTRSGISGTWLWIIIIILTVLIVIIRRYVR